MDRCSKQQLDFVIIGSAKCGTTSLSDWLGNHPDVCMSVPKETMFFGSDQLFSKGLPWFFRTCFSHCRGERLLGEATPAYSNQDRHPHTAERLASVFPQIKLIYIVRHPLRRVESAWRMLVNGDPQRTMNPEERHAFQCAREGFASFISDPAIYENAVSTSRYHYQLSEWLRYFPCESVHVMFLEDLVCHRDSSLHALCNFLGIAAEPLLNASLSPRNSADERRSVRSFVSFIVSSRVHRLVPGSLRSLALRSRLFSKPQKECLNPIWPRHIHSDFTRQVRPDSESFLESFSKPTDFYSFEDAALES